jgi:3'-phosphoadenosine 5'-phosphosulfate sulfotransferase (PAPS reductase)/FAD synthetase
MKQIVLYSMGICSAYIACRLKDEGHDPFCLFSDTKREDEDTYRFGHEVARRWNLNVVEASDGRDLWDVFIAQRMIPARQISMCSIRMKIKPSQKWLEECKGSGWVHYGYDLDEEERAERTRKNWKFEHLSPSFPLIEWGISKAQCFGYFNAHNVKTPRIYERFQNANCLPFKNFSVKDWIALGYHYPDKFNEAMAFEEANGLRWIQEGTTLREVMAMVPAQPPTRKGRRKLQMMEPAFSFDMGCDRCAAD